LKFIKLSVTSLAESNQLPYTGNISCNEISGLRRLRMN